MLFATTGAGGAGTSDNTRATDKGRGEYLSSEGLLAGNNAASAADTPCTGVLTGAWDIIGIGTGGSYQKQKVKKNTQEKKSDGKVDDNRVNIWQPFWCKRHISPRC